MKYVLLILFALVVSCTDTALYSLEGAARNLRECQVHQVTENECVKHKQAQRTARLKAIQSGATEKQIGVSQLLGRESVKGDPRQSPYIKSLEAEYDFSGLEEFSVKP